MSGFTAASDQRHRGEATTVRRSEVLRGDRGFEGWKEVLAASESKEKRPVTARLDREECKRERERSGGGSEGRRDLGVAVGTRNGGQGVGRHRSEEEAAEEGAGRRGMQAEGTSGEIGEEEEAWSTAARRSEGGGGGAHRNRSREGGGCRLGARGRPQRVAWARTASRRRVTAAFQRIGATAAAGRHWGSGAGCRWRSGGGLRHDGDRREVERVIEGMDAAVWGATRPTRRRRAPAEQGTRAVAGKDATVAD